MSTPPTGGVNGQVSATLRQQFRTQVNAATADKIITDAELQQLRDTVQTTTLSDGDKQILGQIVERIGSMRQQGEGGLSDAQLTEIEGFLAQMESPQAEGFGRELRGEAVAPAEASQDAAPPNPNDEPFRIRPMDTPAPQGAGGSDKSIFEVIIGAIVKFFGAIFAFVGSLAGSLMGGGDQNNVNQPAEAPFEPNANAFNANGEAPQEVNTDAGGAADTNGAVTPPAANAGNFERYLALSQAGAGDIYQRSPHHDDSKFVPRFPMAAYHESGAQRGENDPYAVGAISQGAGSKSYGTYHIDGAAQGEDSSLARFVGAVQDRFPSLAQAAQTHGLGSPEFDRAWQELAQSQNQEFGTAQEQFVFSERQSAVSAFMASAGLSEQVQQDPRTLDLLMGTSVYMGDQMGSIAQQLAQQQQTAGEPLSVEALGRALASMRNGDISNWFAAQTAAAPTP